jgi:hypothetical protein
MTRPGRKIDCWRATTCAGRRSAPHRPEALYSPKAQACREGKPVVNATACTIHNAIEN